MDSPLAGAADSLELIRGGRVIISGGAGFLGRILIPELLKLDCRVRVVSRDEAKHHELRRTYPEVETFVCDVRNYPLLRRYTRGQDFGIWAASMKQIDACSQNREEAKAIILDGALNSRCVSEEHLKAACFISTDKSRAPTTLYGYLKGAAGESFILHNNSSCRLSTAIYGNVWNSTGSVLPVIRHHLATGTEATLYHEDMTRFMVDKKDAVDLIFASFLLDGKYILPKVDSFRVKDLFEIYAEEFGLRYKIGHPRPSEKIHELLATREDALRMREFLGKYWLIDPYRVCSTSVSECSSEHHVVAKETLYGVLRDRGFFLDRSHSSNAGLEVS